MSSERSRRANVKPERCSPNVLLGTGTEADFGYIAHQIIPSCQSLPNGSRRKCDSCWRGLRKVGGVG